MAQHKEDEIALLNKAIDCLEKEVKLKNELIQSQEIIIKTLEEHNKKLTELMNRILNC